MNNVATWVNGETVAKDYLIKNGYEIIAINYKTALGELDIIAKDKKESQINKLKQKVDNGVIDEKAFARLFNFCEDTIVFVEVKARQTNSFGSPLDAITPAKQRKICQSANVYLKSHKLLYKPCRFDCIAICGDKLEHIENAFNNIY